MDVRFRSKDERELVSWARGRGWELDARNRMGHLTLRWPQTGAKVPISSSASGRAVENAKAQLVRTEELGTSRPSDGTVRPDPKLAEQAKEIEGLREKLARAQAGEYAAQVSLIEAKNAADQLIAKLKAELQETWALAQSEAEARRAAEAELERLRADRSTPKTASAQPKAQRAPRTKPLNVRVKILRAKLGLNQRDVGLDAGLPRSHAQPYVSRCELGRSLPEYAEELLAAWASQQGG